MSEPPAPRPPRPAPWRVAAALAAVYLCWGTTYLAIRAGVRTLPPGLFGGVRVGLAGAVLLAVVARRGSVRLPGRELGWAALTGGLLFVGGNGLLTLAERTVASGVASVLAATTPIWMALIEAAAPGGDRLSAGGWAGLLLGLAGVGLLYADTLDPSAGFLAEAGPLLVLGSAVCWAAGSSLSRHRRGHAPHLLVAAYQMLLGGAAQAAVGLLCGEAAELSAAAFTPGAVYAFFHLLVFGSLVGFVAFTWLLGHVPAALVGTYSYVNPAVALLAGWLVGGEALTPRVVAGMGVILAGVALVRAAAPPGHEPAPEEPGPAPPPVAGPAAENV
jgi:drug/metabolite transporter (DMT)-like permease